MTDYTNDPNVVLVFGKGQSGKTSFVYKYLLNSPARCVFIYDKSGQAQKRLGLRPAGTALECETALASGWVCFTPHRMFKPHQSAEAFAWFLNWCMTVCQRGDGRKILFVDELWDECTPQSVPDELLAVVKTGRFWGLEFFGVTHRPREFPIALRSNVTEWVCFHTVEEQELREIRSYYPNIDRAARLPTRGRFVAYNRDTTGEMCGGFSDAPGGWQEYPLP